MTPNEEYLLFFESLWREYNGDEAATRRRLREWSDARHFVFYDMGLAEFYEEPEEVVEEDGEPAQPPAPTSRAYRYRHYDQHIGLLRDYISLEYGRRSWENYCASPFYPACRLWRLGRRDHPRDWQARWAAAYDSLPPEEQAKANREAMAALTSCAIWPRLSVFGLPWPPYDYNSGMDVHPLNVEEAAALGLVSPPEPLPEDLPFDITVEIEKPR